MLSLCITYLCIRADEIILAVALTMKQSSITFCGTAKDVRNNLPNILRQVTLIGSAFTYSGKTNIETYITGTYIGGLFVQIFQTLKSHFRRRWVHGRLVINIYRLGQPVESQ